jgi:DNA-binding response OmpR family regulator
MTGRPAILVVEDDADEAEMVAYVLAELGAVTVAADLPEAVSLLENGDRPDVVLLDLNLPGGDGLSLLQSIRAASGVPVVVVSGRAGRADRDRGWGLGADLYLTKPVSPAELRAHVKAILRRA